jgi:hypothetical protein
MSQRRFFAACAAMILGVALLPASAAAQQTTLKQQLVGSSLFGTYTVDEAAKTIIYKVESSTFPNWVGQEQIRPIDSITSDELRHSNAGASIAGAKTVNIWKRAK